MSEETMAECRDFWKLFYPDWVTHEFLEDSFRGFLPDSVNHNEKTKKDIYRLFWIILHFGVLVFRDYDIDEGEPSSIFYRLGRPVTPEDYKQAERNLRAELAEFCESYQD